MREIVQGSTRAADFPFSNRPPVALQLDMHQMESWKARMLGPRVTAVLAFVLLALAPAGAQQPGQGVAQQPQQQDAAPAPVAPALDYREEMRRFIQAIGAFAQQSRRDFLIIPQNGLELLEKVDAIDTNQRSPARTYMRSIDGVLQEALYFGDPDFDKPPKYRAS